MTTSRDLRNIIAIMGSIDRHEIEEAEGRPLPEAVWARFHEDPFRAFLRTGDARQSAIARIVSARMAPAGGEGVVGVKPLEWEDKPGLSRAQTNIIACYSVWDAGDHWKCSLIDGQFKNVDEAKAAAQNDWETRIRAALSTATPPVSARMAEPAPQQHVVGVRPLEWRPGYRDDQVTIWQADTIGGIYQIRILDGVVWMDDAQTGKKIYPSVDEAKATAQADHDTRIRALTTATEGEAAPDLIGLAKVAVDHIQLMYSGIAGGNAVAGENFASKDPVVAALRAAIAQAEGATPAEREDTALSPAKEGE